MDSLAFHVDDRTNTLRCNYSRSAAWTDDFEALAVSFYVEPDLADEVALQRALSILNAAQLDWIESHGPDWRVNCDGIRDRLTTFSFSEWFHGARIATLRISQATHFFNRLHQRHTDVAFIVSEQEPAAVVDTPPLPEEARAVLVQIQSKLAYKSIEAIAEPIELPRFAVLTGRNGAGKTHLLQGIADGTIVLSSAGKPLQPTRYVNDAQLAPVAAPLKGDARSAVDLRQLVEVYRAFRNARAAKPSQRLNAHVNPQQQWIIDQIRTACGKAEDDLDDADFERYWPIRDYQPTEVFAEKLATICVRYYQQRESNLNAQIKAERYGRALTYLSAEEFVALHGEPPWVFVNKALRDAGMDIELAIPEEIVLEAPFVLQFRDLTSGAVIQSSDISSGEKVLLSLIAAMYNLDGSRAFPSVLLMDEPDSHLHPSMTRLLLSVLERTFVEEKGLVVLMTTHSPSTVALAPKDSLFAVRREAPRITRVTKDQALGILLEGVPSLSVSHENRRQVFVESEHDSFVLEALYALLRNDLIPEVSLAFLHVGQHRGRGGCATVVDVVSRLRGAGATTVLGVVDGDGKDTTPEGIKMLGQGSRHSIENYLLDPLYIAACVVRAQKPSPETIGLPEGTRFHQLLSLSQGELQTAATTIARLVGAVHADTRKSELVEVSYRGGFTLELPEWYLTTQGHGLEESLLKAIQSLHGYKKGQPSGLIRAIAELIVPEVPAFVPGDIVTMMKELQSRDLQVLAAPIHIGVQVEAPPAEPPASNATRNRQS